MEHMERTEDWIEEWENKLEPDLHAQMEQLARELCGGMILNKEYCCKCLEYYIYDWLFIFEKP